MQYTGIRVEPVDRWIIDPMKRFIGRSSTSGIVLFSSAALAFIVANTPLADAYHRIWDLNFSIGYDRFMISKDLRHWINDGLMAVFFFVIGLELKREIMAGELSQPRNAIMPLTAAIGGMLFPAVIYLMFNSSGEPSNGWGIAMATDIAFALGILYLLGDRVPISLKVFITALAIVDDIGAVLVIAFFYTSDINMTSLLTGAVFMAVLIGANRIGVRSTMFYAIVGIGGLWLAFLMSGVHATIAAVLAAFTIPADVKVSAKFYSERLNQLLSDFRSCETNTVPTVSKEQFHILEEIRNVSKHALTPLQRLEHGLHPIVAFIVMPIFAFSNAGVTLESDIMTQLTSPVTLGVFAGLLAGKLIGVSGLVYLLLRLRWLALPAGMNMLHVLGAGFLAAVGFTMSLFIAGLAFTTEAYLIQSKIGILTVSLVASVSGYFIIRAANRRVIQPDTEQIRVVNSDL